MTTLAAGSTVQVTLPVGSVLTMSGLGTHQVVPPGVNGAVSPKPLVQIGAQPLTVGPLVAAIAVTIAAAAGGPGVKYAMSSSNPSADVATQDIVTVSRNLLQSDNGTIIPVANGVKLTAVAGTLTAFSCIVMPVVGATATIGVSGGATSNGATADITRTRTANIAGFSVIQDTATAQDAFAVAGS